MCQLINMEKSFFLITCRYCDDKIKVFAEVLFDPKLKYAFHYCNSCRKIQIALLKYQNNVTRDNLGIPVHFNYNIRITYGILTETHSGFCTYPQDICILSSTLVITYPLLRTIQRERLMTGFLDTTHPALLIYDIEPKYHGNGQCNCFTRYYIEKAEIIPNALALDSSNTIKVKS